MSHTELFRGIDRAVFAAAFAQRLRAVGLSPTLGTTGRFAAAIEVSDPRDREELYWVARTCLVDDVWQIPVFDGVFAGVFDQGSLGVDPSARRRPADASVPRSAEDDLYVRTTAEVAARQPGGGGVPWATPPSATEPDAALSTASVIALPRPSPLAERADVPFDELDGDELALVGTWLEEAVLRWPRRRARRRHPTSRHRMIDRRRTVRLALRTAGEPVVLARVRPVTRPRGVVMVTDVSRSMQPFARAYLHLMRALGTIADAETFAFSTQLTRLTATLRHRDVAAAIAKATDEVEDRFGGTRIASSLGQLMRHPAWNTAVRGAVVIIASDGWDADPSGELDARMRRLRRLAHRVVWINPRSASERFAPSTAGMAAALPHCDLMVSGHSLAAVEDLFALLADPEHAVAAGTVGDERR